MLNEFKLNMLNREASNQKNKPEKIIECLKLNEGMIVGDIGSGGGFFVQEFSKKVGDNGLIYGIDVKQENLDFIKVILNKKDIFNVKLTKAEPDKIDLPEKSVDLFFMRNVFHHLHQQVEYFKNIRKLLKEQGKVAIIDYKNRKLSITGLFGHYTPETDLIDIMDDAGFYPQEKYNFLQDQLFIVFALKS
jgi:arsenite methyltransferase